MSWHHDTTQAKRHWVGPLVRYDLIKEGIIAIIVIAILVIGLTKTFGSPKVPAVTFQDWARADANDFVNTTLNELAGISDFATYGPPYNDGKDSVQSIGPFSPQAWIGVHIPVDPAQDFVIAPLSSYADLDSDLQNSLLQWEKATDLQKQQWIKNATSSNINLKGTTITFSGNTDTGPITTLLKSMLLLAQSGALDLQLFNAPNNTYSMNYTKSLLYQADGNYLGNIANHYNLLGDQWGMMNQLGSWPGQPWLWIYTIWYKMPPWGNVDLDILPTAMFSLVILILLLLPFIPGLRSLPRGLKVYRLVWRSYYKKYGTKQKIGKSKPDKAD